MSYAVIHMQKLKAGGIRGIENHNERLKTSRTNPDIDYERSHLNKDLLAKDERTYYMRIKERIEELNLSKAIRKDAVVACGFICTSDQAYFEGLFQAEKDRFFQASHDFLKERYGERNVISSKVHYDETTPHLHCYIVPVTSDNRLSAKSIFTPKELRGLQDDYHRHMREHGFDLQRGNPDSERKHLDVEEYKIKTRYEKLNKEKEEFECEKNDLKQRKGKYDAYVNRLNVEEKKAENREQMLIKKNNFLGIEEKKVLAMEEVQGQRKARIESESKNLVGQINTLKSEINILKHDKIDLQQQINSGKRECDTLERQINTYQNVIIAFKNDFTRFKDLNDVLNETVDFWDVLERGGFWNRQEQTDCQTDIICIQTACLAKHGIDILDSILGSLQALRISHSNGWDEYEAKANLSKLIGPEAAEKLKYKERPTMER
nr:putative plasmid recombination enzyme [uncultured bacterium]